MTLIDSIKMAFSSIFAHKLRSVLTMVGIIIGVGSVITVVAIGQGGEAALKTQFAGSGNNTLEVTYNPGDNAVLAMSENMQPPFTEDDIYHLQKIDEISDVITSNDQTTKLFYFKNNVDAQVVGITGGYYEINSITPKQGELISESDMERGQKVMIVNEDVAEKLFENTNPIGQIVEIEGIPLKIVGVFDDSSNVVGLNMPKVIVPLTIWPILFGTSEIQSITIKSNHTDDLELAGNKAVEFLNSSKNVEGEYEVFNFEEIQEGVSTITRIMTAIIGGIASISLVVGGIGVMNIMMVSVTERTREIGIRKALGATRKKILLQFLIESITLTLIGGIIGIVLGIVVANIVSYIANWPSLISVSVVIGGVVFSMVIGIIFGLIPANKAAKLNPIDALRYE